METHYIKTLKFIDLDNEKEFCRIKYTTKGKQNLIDKLKISINKKDVKEINYVLFCNMFYTQFYENKVLKTEQELILLFNLIKKGNNYHLDKETNRFVAKKVEILADIDNFIEYDSQFKKQWFKKIKENIGEKTK